ncbi:mitogen-activated protein kinase kinase kinase 20-like [Diospyros lotus]|uniref:mitogen-activated protein kinase kinase kinase 20-like n=1 Tax=Diospyros lotus TaxID=55363 RepID=UPI00224DCBBA|nr:mitogen-activated protein kinase kinase kinase 20-like [Diospyros lotus]
MLPKTTNDKAPKSKLSSCFIAVLFVLVGKSERVYWEARMQWSRGEKLGSGASGTVYVAYVLQDQCTIKNGLPSNVMAVKSAEVERAGLLLKEKKLLARFQSCGSLADQVESLGRGLSEDEVRKHTQSILKEDAKIADLGSTKKDGNTLKQKQGKPSLRGTPMYTAVESILQQDYQPETDIWALGYTVLQLITKKEPWKREPGMASAALIFRIAFTDKVPQIPCDDLMSSKAEDFLNRCLVKDLKSRWTADKLLGHPFLSATKGIQEQSNKKAQAVPEGEKASHSSFMSQSSLGQTL